MPLANRSPAAGSRATARAGSAWCRAMDKHLRRSLGEAADALPDGRRYFDLEGPAIYQVEPAMVTIIACWWCQFVSIVPSLPRVLRLVHPCSNCGALIVLRPPLEVLGARDAIASAIDRVDA